MRNGPPDPPSIFIGSATIVAPVGGSSDMSATFSNAGMSFVISATCVAKSFDWPRSIDGVSMPTAPIRREISCFLLVCKSLRRDRHQSTVYRGLDHEKQRSSSVHIVKNNGQIVAFYRSGRHWIAAHPAAKAQDAAAVASI